MILNACTRYILTTTFVFTILLSAVYNVNGEDQKCLNPNSDGTCAANANSGAKSVEEPLSSYPGLSDHHELCAFWENEGECDNNPQYMKKECFKSCLLNKVNNSLNGTCTLYMAESSIPNSGWGMYSASHISEGQNIPQPEILLNILDYIHHLKLAKRLKDGLDVFPEGIQPDQNDGCAFWAKSGECDVNPSYMRHNCQESCFMYEEKQRKGLLNADNEEEETDRGVYWLPHNYYWDSASPGTTHEGSDVESLIPGVGALANSHTGLWNTEMSKPTVDGAGLHRNRDPGAGAISPHYNLNYRATRNITAGEEIFAEYGDNWFADREEKFGPLPLSHDFENADKLLNQFRDITIQDPSSSIAADLLSLSHELSQANTRLGMIIPSEMKELEQVREAGGPAMRTVPNVIQSMEWLQEHGTCLDNIIAAPSTIPQAGRGAFATRTMTDGQIIAPAPLIQVHRDHLKMYKGGQGREGIVYSGDQLLLNYCFGHPDSTVMFFSYGPVVNFINHNSDPDLVNAKIQWAEKSDTHLMDLSAEDLLKKETAGVMIEFVATRDIKAGEEIFIDYGNDWKEAWDGHVRSWKSDDTDSYSYDLKALDETSEIIRSEREQEQDPYPTNAMTLCYISPEIWSFGGKQEFRKVRSRIDLRESIRCEIIERTGPDSKGPYTYIVNIVEPNTKEEKTVIGVPRYHIELVDRPYSRDYNLPNSFRHEIGIPDEIFPSHWLI